MERDITKYLQTGKANAISKADLSFMMGLSIRTFEAELHRQRCNGAIIASCPEGYFLPANHAELAEYIAFIESRCKALFSGIKAARKALSESLKQSADVEPGDDNSDCTEGQEGIL